MRSKNKMTVFIITSSLHLKYTHSYLKILSIKNIVFHTTEITHKNELMASNADEK